MTQIREIESIGMAVTCRANGSFLRGVLSVGHQRAKLIIRAEPDSEPDFDRKKVPRFDIFMVSFGGSSWMLSNLSVETVKSAIEQAETISRQQSDNALAATRLDQFPT